ncbi:MAG: hypothetical protein N3I35_12235 [Clostridia bacterium]|nr:hypothetical protein [Clostridia bacterium]
MNKLSWERLKFYFLIVLIMTSILQVGILWSYQDYGFPINFFGRNTVPEDISDEHAAKSLFLPFRIVLSEGSGDSDKDEPSRWIIGNNKDTDYIKLWGETKQYLKNSLSISQKPSLMSISEWGRLAIQERVVIFEFKTVVGQNLYSWLLDVDSISNDSPKEVFKIMVAPWQNSGMLYISDNVKVYAYNLSIDEKNLIGYEDIINRYSGNNDKNLRKYNFFKEFDPKSKHRNNFSDDVLVITKGQYSNIKDAYSNIPERLNVPKTYTQEQVDQIASAVLGAGKDGYDRTIDSSNNSIEFKTQNKIYKLYKNGYLEYKYLTEIQESDKGEIKEALVNTYRLLNGIKALVSEESSVYLSGIRASKGAYLFDFDYMVDGIPITFIYQEAGQDMVKPAITVEANSKDVLSCTAYLKSFEQENTESVYNVYFSEMLDELYKNYKEFKNDKTTEIKDIRISYSVKANQASQQIRPVWVLETSDKKFIVPMHLKQ